MKENKIETLNENKGSNDNIKDIPTPFFKPISEFQKSQEQLMKNYQEKEEISPTIDLNNEIRLLEQKLNQKKYNIPFATVICLILIINIAWYLGVKFLIIPKYENYVNQNEEIKQNYDSLKRKVDALVGD